MGKKFGEEPLAEPNTGDVSEGEQVPTLNQSFFGDTEVRVYRPFDELPLKWDPSPQDK